MYNYFMTSMFSTKFKIIGSIKCMKFNAKWIYRGRPEFSWFQKNIGASSSQKQYKWIRKTTDIWKKPERDTKKNTRFSSRWKEQKYIGTLGRTIDVRKKPKWFTKGKRYALVDLNLLIHTRIFQFTESPCLV